MRTRTLVAALLIMAVTAVDTRANATILIVNGNAPGVGFNDPTPRAPVGGNTGTTLGEQRLIAFQHAADKWAATLDSPVPIVVLSGFFGLTCTMTGATLGAAGTSFILRDFLAAGLAPGPVAPNTWHGGALADKRAGEETNPGFEDMQAVFNSNLNGNPACLGGRQFYLGLDNQHGNDIDLVAVLLHEFAHGLGFQQFASVTSGARPQNLNDVFNTQIFDNTTLKTWPEMNDDERKASAINPRNVVFRGSEVAAAVPSVLTAGTPVLTVSSPPSVAGIKAVGTAAFGPPLSAPGVSGQLVVGLDEAIPVTSPTTTDGCTPFTNAAAVAGKIAVVDRGTCGFAVKVKNAQNAGAIAAVVVNNVAGGPPPAMGGADPTIVIPSVQITQADGNALKTAIAGGAVTANVGVNLSVFAGADASGFALLNSPNPVVPGSSISHWDAIAFRNQLMEPAINADLTHSVEPPDDLTLPFMRDIGWFPDTDVDGLANSLDACPASNFEDTVSIDGDDTGVANVLFTTGCTISDLVANVAAGSSNHGGFVSNMTALLKLLEDAGIITKAERQRMHDATAHANIP